MLNFCSKTTPCAKWKLFTIGSTRLVRILNYLVLALTSALPTATVSIQHLEKVKQLDDDCPKGCKCVPDRMFYSSENRLEFIAKVDCSNLDPPLRELPLKLPEHTLSLNISNNSISSLVPLTNNDFYKGIRDLFADDNLIESLEEIEGTEFLENFTKLSLKNNKIKFVSSRFNSPRLFSLFYCCIQDPILYSIQPTD